MQTDDWEGMTWRNFSKHSTECIFSFLRHWIKEAQPACLIHPHGFHVVRIREQAGRQWRLHVWHPTERPRSGLRATIHTHEHKVQSRVLRGRLTNIEYRLSPPDKKAQPVFAAHYHGCKYSTEATNTLVRTGESVSLKESSRQDVVEGKSYSVPAHTFHEAIVPPGTLTITMVLMSDPRPGVIKVVGNDGDDCEISFKRAQANVNNLLELLV